MGNDQLLFHKFTFLKACHLVVDTDCDSLIQIPQKIQAIYVTIVKWGWDQLIF